MVRSAFVVVLLWAWAGSTFAWNSQIDYVFRLQFLEPRLRRLVGGKEKPDIWMTVMMRRKTVPSFLVCLVVVVVLSFVCKLGVSNTAPEGGLRQRQTRDYSIFRVDSAGHASSMASL